MMEAIDPRDVYLPDKRAPRVTPPMDAHVRRRKGKPAMPPAIAPRLLEVADQVVKGKRNQQIADELHLSIGTVRVYLSKLYSKTGSRNRTELAVWRVKSQSALEPDASKSARDSHSPQGS